MESERLGRFEIESLLGQGGMGSVYAAVDTESGERVALKVLSGGLLDDEAKFRRFEQEVAALSRLHHENIVRLLGPIEREGQRVFFPMELLEGETLAKRLRRDGAMSAPEALGIIRPVLSALGAAHRGEVVHRDVKPSNIVLTPDAVKITDFGLARMDDLTRLTVTGQIMGTLEYMSPEQCDGGASDGRSDLYSVGIVLYEMLAGTPPFRRETPGAVLKGHLRDSPTRLEAIRADLPDGLADIVARLLAKNPADRFRTAEDVLEAVDALDAASATISFLPDWRERFDDAGETEPAVVLPVASRWGVVAGVVALAALVLAGGAYLLLSGRQEAGSQDARTPEEEARVPPASPDEVLARVHSAMRERDFAGFSACFEPGVLGESLGDAPRQAFLAAVEDLSDFEFAARLPMMGAGSAEESARIVTSPALSVVFDMGSGGPLRVAFRQSSEGSTISEIEEAEPPRRGPGPGPGRPGDRNGRDRRNLGLMVRGIFDRLEQHAPEFMERLVERGFLTRERVGPTLERLRAATAKGPLDLEILEEETRMSPQKVELTVRSRGLAAVLESGEDRFVLVFTRGRGDRRWRFQGMRLADE